MWWVILSLPKEFSTKQEYSPASVLVTDLINREPSGNWRIRSLLSRGAPLTCHEISGAGTPTVRQGSFTSSRYVATNESSNDAIIAGTWNKFKYDLSM